MSTETTVPTPTTDVATPVETSETQREQLRVRGEQLVERVKELIHEGNVRRLIIKHEGHIVVEIPVTLGVIGAVLAPTLAAVGAIGVLVTDCTVEVVRTNETA